MKFIVFDSRNNRLPNLETYKQERRATAGGLDNLTIETKNTHIQKYYRLLYEDNTGKWREYIVTDIEEVHDNNGTSFSLYAENSFIETNWSFIEDRRSYGQHIDNAISIALENTKWIGNSINISTKKDINFYRTSVFQAVENIMKIWNCEIETEINVSKNSVLSRKVYFRHRVGRSLDKRFSWSKDMTSISRRVNDDEVVTALYGFGNALQTESGGYGRKIDFAELNDGLMYVADEEAKSNYGYLGKNGLSHRFGKVEFQTDDKKELLQLTISRLEEVSKPRVTYKASVVDLSSYGYHFEEVEEGDFVGVRDKDLNIAIKARIMEVVEDLDGIEPKKLVIGNFVDTIATSISSLENNINNLATTTQEQINQVANTVKQTADGQNHIFSGPDEPTAFKNNDIWFKLLPSGVEVMYRWNGTAWVEIVDPQKMDTAVQAIQDIEQKAQEAFTKAEEALNKIEVKLVNDETGKVVGISMINDDGSESILFQIGDDGKVQITEEYFYIKQKLITNEMLAEGISADKITSGTLDAAMATIINLNASNMTAGRLTGAKFFLDLDTGEMNLGNLLMVDATGAANLSEQAKSELKGDTGEQGPRGLQGQQGPEGKQGIQGPEGKDGLHSYTHIAYATGDQGQSFNHDTFPQATHIGMYVSHNQNSSDNWRDYKWTLIRGRDGRDGIEGKHGTAGMSSFVHFAYADSADGTVNFSTTDSNREYIGTYTDSTITDYEGGRNLLLNTNREHVAGTREYTREYMSLPYDLTPIFDEYGLDQEYTMSFDLKSKNTSNFDTISIYPNPGTTNPNRYGFPRGAFKVTTEYQRFSMTFKPTDGNKDKTTTHISVYGQYNTGNFPILRNIKLEKDNIATDWTPAPEDIIPDSNNPADYSWTKIKGDKGSTGPKGDPGADGKDAIVVSATTPTDTTRIWRKSLTDNELYIYVSGAWTRVDQEALSAISDKADISLLQAIREEMEKQNSESSKLIGENEVTIGAILDRLSQLKNGDGTGTLDLIQQDMQGLIDREVVWNQDKIDEIIASLQNQYPELFKLTQRVSMDDTGTTFYATDSEGGVMSTATKIKNDGMYIETDGIDVARFTREGTRTRNLQVDGNAYFGNHMVFKSGDDYTIFSHVGNLGQM